MKVLMITPRVDTSSDVFGFIYYFVEELAKKVEKLVIITPKTTKDIMPNNVIHYPLDKYDSRFMKSVYFQRLLFKIIKKEKIDIIFTHMYLEFAIASTPLSKLFNIPLVTWYSHGNVDLKLKIANKLVDKMVTPSPRSFLLKSDKLVLLNHMTDTNLFVPLKKPKNDYLIATDRISRIKGQHLLIEALSILHKKGHKIKLKLVGPINNEEYLNELKELAKKLNLENYIEFTGPLPHKDLIPLLQNCAVLITNQHESGLAKTVLEAMSCAKPVVVWDKDYIELCEKYTKDCLYEDVNSAQQIAEKTLRFLEDKKFANEVGTFLRKSIHEKHSLDACIKKLIPLFEEVINKKST